MGSADYIYLSVPRLDMTVRAHWRLSEALHLRIPDIDSQRMMIRVQHSKGPKDRYVQLSPKLLDLLHTYGRKLRPQPWLFPGQDPSQPLSREAVGQAVAHASPRAGLRKETSPHSLRHAYAVHLLEAGTECVSTHPPLRPSREPPP
jgi:site-specific recombinase XerD